MSDTAYNQSYTAADDYEAARDVQVITNIMTQENRLTERENSWSMLFDVNGSQHKALADDKQKIEALKQNYDSTIIEKAQQLANYIDRDWPPKYTEQVGHELDREANFVKAVSMQRTPDATHKLNLTQSTHLWKLAENAEWLGNRSFVKCDYRNSEYQLGAALYFYQKTVEFDESHFGRKDEQTKSDRLWLDHNTPDINGTLSSARFEIHQQASPHNQKP